MYICDIVSLSEDNMGTNLSSDKSPHVSILMLCEPNFFFRFGSSSFFGFTCCFCDFYKEYMRVNCSSLH